MITSKITVLPLTLLIAAAPLSAKDWLENQERLRKTFEQNAIWLMKQNGDIRFEKVTSYNKTTPFPYNYVFRPDEWDKIINWNTPAIYFFDKTGKLIVQVFGWPPEGNEERVINAVDTLWLQ